MKTLLNALKGINKLGLVLVLVAATLVFTQSAFKSSTAVRYQYMNNTATNIDQVSSWQQITGTEPTCDNEEDLPCVIEVDGSLASYLDNKDVQAIFESPEFRSSKSQL